MSEELHVEQPEQEAPAGSARRKITNWFREVMETVLPALLIVLIVNIFLAQATRVEGQSMEPNIHDNQRLVVEKVSYRFHLPDRGDIVVLKPPNWKPLGLHQRIVSWFCTALPLECSIDVPDPLIKRVIALPGETIEIKDGHVFINGQVLEEPYLQQLTFGNVPPRVLSPGHVFVLGDNRGASNDSRSFGEVALSNVVGRAWFRYWPLDDMGPVH
jgi:signal peptidase I